MLHTENCASFQSPSKSTAGYQWPVAANATVKVQLNRTASIGVSLPYHDPDVQCVPTTSVTPVSA